MSGTAAGHRPVDVLGRELPETEVLELVRRRTLRARLRAALGAPERVRSAGTLYVPVAVMEASATGTGRRRWHDRTRGMVDLLSGRVGLVDRELPPREPREAPAGDVVPALVPPQQASQLWHEFFRDHIDRRRRPMRPPQLVLDRCERLWLPLHLIHVDGGDSLVVDAITRRTDPVSLFPAVARFVREREERSVRAPQEVS